MPLGAVSSHAKITDWATIQTTNCAEAAAPPRFVRRRTHCELSTATVVPRERPASLSRTQDQDQHRSARATTQACARWRALTEGASAGPPNYLIGGTPVNMSFTQTGQLSAGCETLTPRRRMRVASAASEKHGAQPGRRAPAYGM